MSTPQTDASHEWQQSIVEDFTTLSEAVKACALHEMLQQICNNSFVTEKTKDACREIYNAVADTFDPVDDPNVQYQENVLQKERDDREQAETRNAPSEGFEPL